MCGAVIGGLTLDGVHLGKEAVIQGRVTKAGDPVGGAYVRLLDAGGDFTAEVVTSPAGQFRFFAAAGNWTLRVLSATGRGESAVTAAQGTITEAEIALPT